jgi:transcriptional/translational regulatory protein YebC/TACO1
MIDFGVSEIFEEEENIIIYGEFETFGPIQKYLEEHDFEIISADFERIPKDTKELDAEQTAGIEKLLEKLEEDEDVTNVFHTMR